RFEQGVLRVARELLLDRLHLEHGDLVERPAVRERDRLQLGAGFGEADVHPALPATAPLEQELQPQGRLPGTRISLDQIDVVGGKAAAQDVVETGDACRCGLVVTEAHSWGSSGASGEKRKEICEPRAARLDPT